MSRHIGRSYKRGKPPVEPTVIDWARLAAFIDGEGCIRITEKKEKHYPRAYLYLQINISNTDPRLPAWLKKTFGGGVYHSRRASKLNVRWSDCFMWMVSGGRVAELLQGCMPYFIIKREQAETALAFQETIGRKGGPGYSTPPEIVESQYKFKDALSSLKGRSSRRPGFQKRNETLEQKEVPEGLVDGLIH